MPDNKSEPWGPLTVRWLCHRRLLDSKCLNTKCFQKMWPTVSCVNFKLTLRKCVCVFSPFLVPLCPRSETCAVHSHTVLFWLKTMLCRRHTTFQNNASKQEATGNQSGKVDRKQTGWYWTGPGVAWQHECGDNTVHPNYKNDVHFPVPVLTFCNYFCACWRVLWISLVFGCLSDIREMDGTSLEGLRAAKKKCK